MDKRQPLLAIRGLTKQFGDGLAQPVKGVLLVLR